MIELRWLLRMVDRPRGIDDGFHMPPLPDKLETRVLQYRARHFRASPPFNSGFEGWGAWNDVPTVSDDGDKQP
jgi:hypothetical protein